MENAPPFAFGGGVLWITLTPGFRDVPLCGSRRGGAHILWANGTTREKQNHAGCGQKCEAEFPLHHYCFAPGAPFVVGALGCAGAACAGAPAAPACAICLTRTSWPSSSESAGFRTIQSEASRPCKTSRDVP